MSQIWLLLRKKERRKERKKTLGCRYKLESLASFAAVQQGPLPSWQFHPVAHLSNIQLKCSTYAAKVHTFRPNTCICAIKKGSPAFAACRHCVTEMLSPRSWWSCRPIRPIHPIHPIHPIRFHFQPMAEGAV